MIEVTWVPISICVIIVNIQMYLVMVGYIFKQAKICEEFAIWVPIEVLCILVQYSTLLSIRGNIIKVTLYVLKINVQSRSEMWVRDIFVSLH